MSSKRDPYLVFGTGRSGTSFVADVMHNRMEIFMGEKFLFSVVYNPNGTWEDSEFVCLNQKLRYEETTFEEWKSCMRVLIHKRQALGCPWGMKDPRMAFLLEHYFKLFENPRLIWCKRDFHLVVKSFVRVSDFDEEQATFFVKDAEEKIFEALKEKDYLVVNLGKQRLSSDEVVKKIGAKWHEL